MLKAPWPSCLTVKVRKNQCFHECEVGRTVGRLEFSRKIFNVAFLIENEISWSDTVVFGRTLSKLVGHGRTQWDLVGHGRTQSNLVGHSRICSDTV